MLRLSLVSSPLLSTRLLYVDRCMYKLLIVDLFSSRLYLTCSRAGAHRSRILYHFVPFFLLIYPPLTYRRVVFSLPETTR